MSYQEQFGHVDPDERLGYAEEPQPEEEYAPPRLLPKAVLAVGAMAIFAGGLWFAYHEGAKHAAPNAPAATAPGPGTTAPTANDQVPLIHADPDPVKVKPEKAGGMNIPDRDDPIYSMHPGQTPAEHILPPPDPVMPRPTAPPPAPPQVAAAPPSAFPAPLPAPPPPPATQARPAPKPAEAAKPPTAAGPPTKIQLASLRSADEARDEWQRVKRENGDLLGKFTAVAVRADLGDRGTWYRVEVGPVGDKAAALKLCKALRDRDLECQLVQ
jgi:hypothetical protein